MCIRDRGSSARCDIRTSCGSSGRRHLGHVGGLARSFYAQTHHGFFEIEFSRAPWFADDGVDGDVAGSALVPESSGSGSELTGYASGGVAEGSALAEDGVEQG